MTAIPNWFRWLIFGLFVVAISGWIYFSDETLHGSPGRQGDDVYFENIAYHLAKGDGIKFDFTDIQWRRPYHEANASGENDWIFYLQTRGATTSRSPGFPFLVAGVYSVVGHNWAAVRIVVCVLLAGALTWLIECVVRTQGWLVGIVACVTLALDYFVLRTAGQFMSEGLGTAVICVWFCSIIRLTRSGSNPPAGVSQSKQALGWLGAGAIFGIGILVRANLNAWLILGMPCLVALILYRAIRHQQVGWLIWPAIWFCLGVTVLAGPTWIRNCVVTNAFSPFGTSGSFGIVGGYCDAAYANFGNWDAESVIASQQQILAEPGVLQRPLAEQEYLMGENSKKLAREWMSAHPDKLPWLALMKAYSHLGFYRQPLILILINALMLIGAVIGCWVSRHSLGTWIAVIVALSTVATALTWEHYGRYSIPIRPLIHVACAIGTIAFWKYVLRRLKNNSTTS